MGKFKLIELEEIPKDSNIVIFNVLYKDGILFRCLNRKRYNYFTKNKNKYFFIKSLSSRYYPFTDYDYYMVEKNTKILNVISNEIYFDFGKNFYEFVKYHLIKEKLHGEI